MTKRNRQKRISPFLLLSLPTILVVVAAVILMTWPLSTRIQVDVVTSRAVFTVDETSRTSQGILGDVAFRSLTMENFSEITLEPERVQVLNSNSLDLVFPNGQLTFIGGAHAKLTMEGTNVNAMTAIGQLDTIPVNRVSKVTISGSAGEGFAFELKGKEPQAELSMDLLIQTPHKIIKITADQAQLKGSTGPYNHSRSQAYRIRLRHGSHNIRMTGRQKSLVLQFTPEQSDNDNFLSQDQEPLPVETVEFTRPSGQAKPVSALSEGSITYPEYQGLAGIKLAASDILGLSRLKGFVIEELRMDPAGRGIKVRLEGKAGHVITMSTGGIRRDHRLTVFDILKYNPQVPTLFTIAVWVVPTIVGAYRLYKDFKHS